MLAAVTNTIKSYRAWLAGVLIAAMFGLGVGSMAGDAAIVDEIAHIPAGYSYLKYQDFRLNPEHPPLIKDLSALPLTVMGLKFPLDIAAWTTEPNGQWEAGWHFLYHIGNDADKILFWSRLPILLMGLVLAGSIYLFARRRYGVGVGLLSLLLFVFEPNVLAHSRFVTTDLGIALFGFLAFVFYWRWLAKPGWQTGMLAAIFLAVAQVAKFSAVLLLPFFGLLTVLVVLTWTDRGRFWQRVKTYLGGLFLIYTAAFLLIWLFYVPHTLGMPESVQDKLILASLPGGWQRAAGQVLADYNHIPGFKPLVQYLLGILMVFTRVRGGNTTYFLGQVTNQSFLMYFPLTYLIKVPLPLHLLSAAALAYGFYRYLRQTPLWLWRNFTGFARRYFVELSSLLYIAYYSYLSITGNLNLGIRHLLPIMPFVVILSARGAIMLWRRLQLSRYLIRWAATVSLGGLVLWYVAANLWIYPHYVAYFNELIGGPANAHKYVTDSSVDWGQDLKRLKQYVDSRPEIDRIAVDYFGGGDPKYYFCERQYDAAGQLIATAAGYDCSASKYLSWHAEDGVPPTRYIAVSETFLMNDLYYAPIRGDSGYAFLRAREPIAKIGYSIYVYKLD